MPKQFELDDATVYSFGHEFLVVCPRCSKRAIIQDRGCDAPLARIALTCSNCGYSREYDGDLGSTTYARRTADCPPGYRCIGAPVDWYFHLPLWLQAPCCGETLWAYNLDHLAFIEDFVQATLRTNVKGKHGWSNQSLRNRFPAWIKDARHRGEILKCIARLRLKAEG